MIRQIYRFLSILLISNLIISSAIFGQTQKNADNINQNKDNSENQVNNQDPNIQYPNLEKMPPYNHKGSGQFTTMYGVMSQDDIYNSYPGKTPLPRLNDNN